MTEVTTNQEPEIQEADEDNGSSLARESQVRLAYTALVEAGDELRNMSNLINKIREMLPTVNELYVDVSFVAFSHVSKEVRNTLLDKIVDQLGSVDDSVKAAHRAVKGVKRSRLSEDQIDKLILGDQTNETRHNLVS